jgi:hypothetical protein
MTGKNDSHTESGRRPDCVTTVRMGNTVLVVSGFLKEGAVSTADDKMARVLEAESAAMQKTGMENDVISPAI